MYSVIGWDRKLDDEVSLYDTDSSEDAVRWAKRYTKQGDTGGWDMIKVVAYNQVDVDWNGDPVKEEVTLWSFWSEPMRWSDNAYEEF